jgi:NAD(P)-dependent dehydrogenase (short-subunit alcohol dehydrogenase family)
MHLDMSMEGKIIALTGGASGIGLATAKLIASRGATVCIADVDPSALEAAESHFTSLKVSFMVSKVDVSKRMEVDKWIDDIVERYGRLDGAANCAGIIGKHHGLSPISELEDEEWDKIMAVNLTGMMYSLRAELRKIADFGSIVNVASIHGLIGELSGQLCARKETDSKNRICISWCICYKQAWCDWPYSLCGERSW